MEAVKVVLFILMTWGVIVGTAIGAGITVFGITNIWIWAIVASLGSLCVGVVLGEWLARFANAVLYPGMGGR